MFARDSFSIVPGDEAWIAREKARRRREYTLQAVLILILVAFIAVLATNVADNLAAKNIHSGFAFLNHRAGFEIGEQLIAYSSSDPLWKAFLTAVKRLNSTHRLSIRLQDISITLRIFLSAFLADLLHLRDICQ